jgi:hypothetical protein
MKKKERIKEKPVNAASELTMKYLEMAIDAKKNRRQVARQILEEYKVNDIEFLSEEEACDLIKILDEELAEENSFVKELEKLTGIYRVIKSEPHHHLIAKKVKYCIYSLNENNIFMPYEKKEDRNFAVLILVKFKNTKLPSINIFNMEEIGTQLLTVSNWNDAIKKLNSIE